MAPAESKRTGRFIKEYLLDPEHPAASISDIHQAFVRKIKGLNSGRVRSQRLVIPVYSSFYQYFRHFIVLEMVEKVGEGPTEDIESPEEMGYIEKVAGRLRIHKGAAKGIWMLTPKGLSEVEAWDDPLRARGYYPRP